MSRRPPGADDPSRGGFDDVLGGARPLVDRDKLRPAPAPRQSARSASGQREARRFVVEAQGAEIAGRAEDVSRALLAKLRAGRIPPEREIDLHGHAARAAQRLLSREIDAAWRAGLRCVLVIHGRGLHSESEAVLQRALPGWLQEQPLAACVLAFASAKPARGGAGATLVLLRRARVSSAAPEQGGEQGEA